ncbi:MAG: hypothetical protein GOV15_04315, partial [Candidatus Diapherotrites archaeon]|nr:hypothetical protein [Candidatus Diapherotrites archaeon]
MRTELMLTLIDKHANSRSVKRFLEEGVSGFRITLGYGSLQHNANHLMLIRKVSSAFGVKSRIYWDCPGEKVRLGKIKKFKPKQGQTLTFSISPSKTALPLSMSQHVLHALKAGDEVVVSDGLVHLTVSKILKQGFKAKVDFAYDSLASFKGVAFPNSKVDYESFTPFDVEALKVAAHYEPDFAVVSFASSASDVKRARRILDEADANKVKVMAKIESRKGVKNAESILRACDGLMIGRGDLALNTSFE